MISSENKLTAITKLQAHKTDTGSGPVQASILTERIKELTVHLRVNKKDHMARRGLLQMVGRRKKLLQVVSQKDPKTYLKTIDELGLRK